MQEDKAKETKKIEEQKQPEPMSGVEKKPLKEKNTSSEKKTSPEDKTAPAGDKEVNKEAEEPKGQRQDKPSEKKGPQQRKEKTQRRRGGKPKDDEEGDGIVEQVIKITRVAKVVKGGKNFSFSALVVAGDEKGSYGLGFGKSNEVIGAIKKGSGKARKEFKTVKLKGDTIPHQIIGRYKSSRVILKPAVRGTGVIAGGPVRALCDAIGVKDILTKSLGSRNAINVAKAAADGFDRLRLERKG